MVAGMERRTTPKNEFSWRGLTAIEFLIMRDLLRQEYAVNGFYIFKQILLGFLGPVKEDMSNKEFKRVLSTIWSREPDKAATIMTKYNPGVPSYQRVQRALMTLEEYGWVHSRKVEGTKANLVWYISEDIIKLTKNQLKTDEVLRTRLGVNPGVDYGLIY
ncbi:MAG: hypothetical protein PHF51_00170 [Candidatus ainarchaeum sp.]|nr:hypothetical protein [Candidatus ainarchaeum sp.]